MANYTLVPFLSSAGETIVDNIDEVIQFNVVSDLRFISSPITITPVADVYVYNIICTDTLPDTYLTVSALVLPDWLVFTNNGDGTALLTGLPLPINLGSHSVVLEVTDGYLTLTQSFIITVEEENNNDDGDNSPSENDLGVSTILIFINGIDSE